MLGRLYWSEEQVLLSDVNAMVLGFREHMEMLRSIFGSPSDGAPAEKPPLTPAMFDALFPGKKK